jgi:hypothetical protein
VVCRSGFAIDYGIARSPALGVRFASSSTAILAIAMAEAAKEISDRPGCAEKSIRLGMGGWWFVYIFLHFYFLSKMEFLLPSTNGSLVWSFAKRAAHNG